MATAVATPVPLAYGLPDQTVELFITRLISQKGGKIGLEELERRFWERFNFDPNFFIGHESVRALRDCGRVYKLESGMVSL